MTNDVGGFGYDLKSVENIPLTHPRFVDTLNKSFKVTEKYLPPVGQQGTENSPGYPGSCAAWASTYGLATFYAAKSAAIDPTQPSGQASPAFIYIQVLESAGGSSTDPACGDSKFSSYFSILESGGTANVEDAPYYANCSKLWDEYGDASPTVQSIFKIPSAKAVQITSDLKYVKQVLSSDCPLAYATKLYTDWGEYQGSPCPYSGNGHIKTGKNGDPVGHCMMIIGYDDTMGSGGAIYIQNSQGPGWGSNGYIWMDYSTFLALANGQAYYVDD